MPDECSHEVRLWKSAMVLRNRIIYGDREWLESVCVQSHLLIEKILGCTVMRDYS